MADLRELFRADDLDVDDVWSEIQARAAGRDGIAPRRTPPKADPSWRRIAIIAAALAIGIGSLAFLLPAHDDGSSPATPTGSWSPAALRGWIAFSSRGTIFAVDPDAQPSSSDPRALFQPADGATWPLSWSPDGSSLLFVWRRPADASDSLDRTSLNVLHDDGSVQQLTQPASHGAIAEGSFAPDGTVLVSSGVPGGRIERFDLQTGERTSIAVGSSGTVMWPAERPDGTIAFIHIATNGFTSIVTKSADGHERTVAPLPSSKDASGLSWSPDGTRIVAGVLTNANVPLVFVLNADGSGLHQVIDGTFPSWSPDGSRLALDKQGALITIAPDGTTPEGLGVRPEGSGVGARVGPWNGSTA